MNHNLLINNQTILLEALKKINKNKKRFLISVDSNKYIKGIVTDGDIRRALIEGNDLNDCVENICQNNFQYLTLDATFDEMCEKFKSEKIDFLPVIHEKKLVNIITKKQFHILLLEDISFDLMFDFSLFDQHILEHEIYNRPWGFYKSTMLTPHAQAKIIVVFPNSELSLQEHKKREEHWVIIKGKGQVILGESVLEAYPGKNIYIPKGCKHQIINNSNENLIFSEVQLGNYFGEDDIIRYSDKYGRK